MGRPPKFSTDQMLDQACELLAEQGASALTVTAIAKRLGAPSGSIYHRFSSRDVLIAELWLRTVERFQAALDPVLATHVGLDAVRAIAVAVIRWAQDHPLDARLLLLHSSSDLLHEGWPPDLMERNQLQRSRIAALVEQVCAQAGASTPHQRRRIAFAMIEIPCAALRPELTSKSALTEGLEELVIDAVDGVLAQFDQRADAAA